MGVSLDELRKHFCANPALSKADSDSSQRPTATTISARAPARRRRRPSSRSWSARSSPRALLCRPMTPKYAFACAPWASPLRSLARSGRLQGRASIPNTICRISVGPCGQAWLVCKLCQGCEIVLSLLWHGPGPQAAAWQGIFRQHALVTPHLSRWTWCPAGSRRGGACCAGSR